MAEQRFAQKAEQDELARQLPLFKAAGGRVVDSLSVLIAPEGSAKNSVFIQYGKDRIPAPVTPARAGRLKVKG